MGVGEGEAPRRRPSFAYWLPVVLYLCLILALSSIPARKLEPLHLASWDKLAHALEYGGLSFLVARALAKSSRRGAPLSPRAVAMAAIAAAMIWGALDENYQRFTGRQCDVFDWLADSTGAGLVQAMLAIRRRVRRTSEKES